MERTTPQTRTERSIDVTGLSDEAVRAVETLVAQLKGQRPQARLGGTTQFSTPEAWSQALYDWAASHKPLTAAADYSRESLYPDRV